jgi:hypothetical protein
MDDNPTGSIRINLVDGSRQPLGDKVQWSATMHDGRSPDDWELSRIDGQGPIELVEGLQFFDNFRDNYTVIVNADGYDDAGWMPVPISTKAPAPVSLMLVRNDSHPNFSDANWEAVKTLRPRFAEIISAGIGDPANRYAALQEAGGGLVAACLLNLLTAMSQISLPSRKSPLDYYWQPIWDDQAFAMAQDRFFAYVDEAIVDDVVKAGKAGSFVEEQNPGTWHPGATLSYKQTQFDTTNVQLTFHQNNTKTLQGPNGPVDCVVIEPDIDYYKDLLSHFLIEVLPNKFTSGLTDPRTVYVLRWIAGRQAGTDFNPLYTLTT